MEKVIGPRPTLEPIEVMDNRNTDKKGDAINMEVTMETGFATEKSKKEETTSTSDLYGEVSGTYGFSAISSVSAKVGASSSNGATTSVTSSSVMNTSTKKKINLIFPQGEFRGYYKWAIEIITKSGPRLLFLSNEIITLTTKEDKAEMEAAAEPVHFLGRPLSVASTKVNELHNLEIAIATFKELLISKSWHYYNLFTGGRTPTFKNIVNDILNHDDITWPGNYKQSFLKELDNTSWHCSMKNATRQNLVKIADNWLGKQNP